MSYTSTIQRGEDTLFRRARFLLAAKFYEFGWLTSGKAGRLCGKGRVDFLLSLPSVGISISNLRAEDATSELEFLIGEEPPVG